MEVRRYTRRDFLGLTAITAASGIVVGAGADELFRKVSSSAPVALETATPSATPENGFILNQPTQAEATIAPSATESATEIAAQKVKEQLYSYFTDTLHLAPALDAGGKLVFIDENGNNLAILHSDNIDNQECAEGYEVHKIIVTFKADEPCNVTPTPETATSSPTATASATSGGTEVNRTSTPTPRASGTATATTKPDFTPTPTPSRTNTLPNTQTLTPTPSRTSTPTQEFSPTPVQTNTHYPIATATEGPAPTLEPTATDIP